MPALWTYGGFYPVQGDEVLLAAKDLNGVAWGQPGYTPRLVNILASQITSFAGSGNIAPNVQAAGSVQANATPLTALINIITSTGLGTGVVLPNPASGVVQVLNRASVPIKVYPAFFGQIESYGSNVGVPVYPGTPAATFTAASPTLWRMG